jgi:uncharacterized SAM-binding protein YcdF (DUF218 family)
MNEFGPEYNSQSNRDYTIPDSLENSGEQLKKKMIDALIVFGFGIRSDKDMEKMNTGQELRKKEYQGQKGWRLPLGAKLRVVAAAETYLQWQVADVIFTGGPIKVNEGVQESEADLMQRYFLHIIDKRIRAKLKDSKISEDEINKEVSAQILETSKHILLEDKATNTIENFANTINYIERYKNKYQNIALLSNEFHLDRIIKLGEKFGLGGIGIPAEKTVNESHKRYENLINRYFDPKTNTAYRNEILSSLSDKDKDQIEARLGTSIEDYLKGEKRWSRGIDEIPEYWLQNVRFIENTDQLKNILKADEAVVKLLKEKGIDNIDKASHQTLVNILGSIDRIIPPKEWEEE